MCKAHLRTPVVGEPLVFVGDYNSYINTKVHPQHHTPFQRQSLFIHFKHRAGECASLHRHSCRPTVIERLTLLPASLTVVSLTQRTSLRTKRLVSDSCLGWVMYHVCVCAHLERERRARCQLRRFVRAQLTTRPHAHAHRRSLKTKTTHV
jgi:hypothetical protein